MAAVRHPQNGPFSDREKLGFELAGRLHVSAAQVDDRFYARLQAAYSDQEIIELAAVAAAFEFFTRFVDALRIPTTPLAASR